jgi:starch synthase (maltosyl-transferring)
MIEAGLAPEAARMAGRANCLQCAPRIYYASTLMLGPLSEWSHRLDAIAQMGFDHLLLSPLFNPSANYTLLHPRLAWDGDAASGLAKISDLARAAGLAPLLDVVLGRRAAGSSREAVQDRSLDPRRISLDMVAAPAPLERAEDQLALAEWLVPLLQQWSHSGIAGFHFSNLAALPPPLIRMLAEIVHQTHPDRMILGWTPGIPRSRLRSLADCGLDFVFASLPWWDFRADWFWEELAALRRLAPVITCPEAPLESRLAAFCHDKLALRTFYIRSLHFAAALGAGWMMPMGFEYGAITQLDPAHDTPEDFARLAEVAPFDLTGAVTGVNDDRTRRPDLAPSTVYRVLSPPAAAVAVVLSHSPDGASLIAVNTDTSHRHLWDPAGLPATSVGRAVFVFPGAPRYLRPGEVFRQSAESSVSIPGGVSDSAASAAAEPRFAIENISPSVDDGRFPARRIVGEAVSVEADVICDGHDVIRVDLLWRARGAEAWQRAPMRLVDNDRYRAAFFPLQLGIYEFTIEAWRDAFGTFCDELKKKHDAGVATNLELREGMALLEAAGQMPLVQRLASLSEDERLVALLSEDSAAAMVRADLRPFATKIDPPLELEAERLTARFASWYEIFPRSMSDDPARHGTFDDVIAHLPRIRDMGFDVLYFPPIHPIGHTNRKGRNNTLTAGPGDPGSPYAIGSADGGHTDIHNELGTLADFRRLLAAAARNGLELALDFAIQCSPDHPWLKQHPDWFAWRPDGSIRYAENPPKKYQDIVNVDFYSCGAVPDLWEALRDVVRFWADEGVRIFRVDNPHTKPLPFWQWLIADIKSTYPETIFLAEAFTKPKMMYRLAKIGFNQSYTYFTWRNTRAELETYLTELTQTPAREFFRPNFFVNTPDINPPFLQNSGRAGFLIRAALAATLSGLWGVYSGFELCEAAALPGREEYLNSEKYEIRARDWNSAGNIVSEISRLNQLRHRNPALQTHLGLTFLASTNNQIMVFEKSTERRDNIIIVAISLDPLQPQETVYELPLWKWGLPDHGVVMADDLIAESNGLRQGKYHMLRLDPNSFPYAIWRIRPQQDITT